MKQINIDFSLSAVKICMNDSLTALQAQHSTPFPPFSPKDSTIHIYPYKTPYLATLSLTSPSIPLSRTSKNQLLIPNHCLQNVADARDLA